MFTLLIRDVAVDISSGVTLVQVWSCFRVHKYHDPNLKLSTSLPLSCWLRYDFNVMPGRSSQGRLGGIV